jgi:hypothetical protein
MVVFAAATPEPTIGPSRRHLALGVALLVFVVEMLGPPGRWQKP